MVEPGLMHGEICAIEQAMFACRPALKTVHDGAWVWRFAQGYTGRANSLQSLDVEDVSDIETRLERHVVRSRAHGIVPRFRVTPLTGQPIIELLDRQGWDQNGHTLVMLADENQVGQAQMEAPDIALVAPGTAQWLAAARDLLEMDGETLETYTLMMAELPSSARGFLQTDQSGRALCLALGVVANEIGALFSLTTAPARRREGRGRRMTQRVHKWLRKAGAKQFALQVEAHNSNALGLYRSLGYRRAYEYYYRTL